MIKEKRVMALGFFDGVHLGHSKLIKRVLALAKEKELIASVVTFDRHPQSVVGESAGRSSNIKLISSLEDRVGLIRRLFSVEDILVMPFDEQTASMKWDDFIYLLIARFDACRFVVGENYRFGRLGEGNSELLQKKCNELGIGCDVIATKVHDGVTVSSTYIRSLLSKGNIERAGVFLDHPHVLTDTVRHGHELGRKLSAPTINMHFGKDVLVPKLGVYAAMVHLDDDSAHIGVSNIGIRPTVSGATAHASDIVRANVETHILDFSRDLYNQRVRIEFHKYLREEKRFENIAALSKQIQLDCSQARQWFEKISVDKCALDGVS